MFRFDFRTVVSKLWIWPDGQCYQLTLMSDMELERQSQTVVVINYKDGKLVKWSLSHLARGLWSMSRQTKRDLNNFSELQTLLKTTGWEIDVNEWSRMPISRFQVRRIRKGQLKENKLTLEYNPSNIIVLFATSLKSRVITYYINNLFHYQTALKFYLFVGTLHCIKYIFNVICLLYTSRCV